MQGGGPLRSARREFPELDPYTATPEQVRALWAAKVRAAHPDTAVEPGEGVQRDLDILRHARDAFLSYIDHRDASTRRRRRYKPVKCPVCQDKGSIVRAQMIEVPCPLCQVQNS